MCYMIAPGVLKTMSMIVCVAGSNYCMIASDSRKVVIQGFDTKEILSDNFEKTFRIGANVFYGMGGHFMDDSEILAPFEKCEDKDSIFIDDALSLVEAYIHDYAGEFCLPRKYILGGKNSEGIFCTYSIDVDSSYQPIVKKFVCKENTGYTVAAPYQLIAKWPECMTHFEQKIKESHTMEQLCMNVGKLILQASSFDESIGGTIKCHYMA